MRFQLLKEAALLGRTEGASMRIMVTSDKPEAPAVRVASTVAGKGLPALFAVLPDA